MGELCLGPVAILEKLSNAFADGHGKLFASRAGASRVSTVGKLARKWR